MAQRATSVKQVFEAMPGRFKPELAGDLNATIQFDLSGEGGGQWCVTVADRKLSVADGTAAIPNMTLSTSASDYLDIVNGDLAPMQAFMQGKLKIKGDMSLALKMQSWLARE